MTLCSDEPKATPPQASAPLDVAEEKAGEGEGDADVGGPKILSKKEKEKLKKEKEKVWPTVPGLIHSLIDSAIVPRPRKKPLQQPKRQQPLKFLARPHQLLRFNQRLRRQKMTRRRPKRRGPRGNLSPRKRKRRRQKRMTMLLLRHPPLPLRPKSRLKVSVPSRL